MQTETAAVSAALLSALDSTLASGDYNDAGNTRYELRIPDAGSADAERGVFTWDARQGLGRELRGAPTSVVEFASTRAFCQLAAQEKEFLELAVTNQIRIGGLFDDVAAFARLFQRHTLIPNEPRFITLPTPVKREVRDEVLRHAAQIGLNDEEAGRIGAILTNYVDHKLDRCALDLIIEMDVPGLEVTPWHDAIDSAIHDIFRDHFDGLRIEATRLLSGEIRPPHYGGRLDAPDLPAGRPPGWRHWRVVSGCRLLPAQSAITPVAASVVRRIAERGLVIAAEYLILEPGARIYPHADGLSWGISLNYGLIVPEGCYLTVAGETRYHREGQFIAFNDGFIHSAGNDGAQPRVLFNVMCANPAFSHREQAVLDVVMRTLLARMAAAG